MPFKALVSKYRILILLTVSLALSRLCVLVWPGLCPHMLLPGAISTDRISRLFPGIFTYGFLHLSTSHLAANLAVLLTFGTILLHKAGEKKFLFIYLSGLLAAGVAFSLITTPGQTSGNAELCGASGALMAVLGYTALLHNRCTVVINRKQYAVPLWIPAAVVILGVILNNRTPGAFGAHIAGCAAGVWVLAIEMLPAIIRSFRRHTTKPEVNGHSLRPVCPAPDIDTIINKLHRAGYDSLTSAERRILAQNSR